MEPRVTLSDAEERVTSCRARLAGGRLTPAARAQVELELAKALATRAARARHAADLIEATDLFQRIATDPAAGPVEQMAAAEEMVNAMRLRRLGLGDVRGWAPALDALERAARRFPDRRYGDGMALLAQAFRAYFLAQEATTPEDAAQHRRDAVALARDAEQRVPAELPLLADLKAMAADALGGVGASADELDEAVEEARAAQEIASRQWDAARGRRNEIDFRDAWLDQGVILATFLLDRARAALDGDQPGDGRARAAGADADEAAALCWRAATRLPHPNGDDTFWFAVALSLRDRAGLDAWAGVPDVAVRPPDVASAFRRAFDDQHANLGLGVQVIALEWFEWARDAGRSAEAGEALWRLLTTVPAEWRRRLTREGREQVIAPVQGHAAEAGWWLANQRREADALLAVEYGRATLFAGPAGYVDPALEDRLRSAGRPEVWREWVAAAAVLDETFRAQFAGGGDRTDTGPVAPEQRTWARYQRACEQVDRAIGLGWDGTPTSYDDLRRGVLDQLDADAVVYVGAAEQGGYALVVHGRDAGGPADRTAVTEPTYVPMPELTEEAVERWVLAGKDARASETSADGRSWPDVLDDLLAWLGSAYAAPLASTVAPGSEIVVVGLGALGFLPLHAVSLEPGGPPIHVVRYAPNARLAVASQRMATRAAGAPVRLLAAAAPPTHGLPASAHEVERIAELYAPDVVAAGMLTHAEVLAALPDATTWHLACHGESTPEDPLESALVLADGRLTLRHLLTRRAGRHRVAVLSACDTDVPDLNLIDEAYTLPGGLLRAGVAGVVATQWEVGDLEAALLCVDLHRRLIVGNAPAHALFEAQAWLRTATSRDVHEASPALVPEPSPGRADERPFEHPVAWAAFCATGA